MSADGQQIAVIVDFDNVIDFPIYTEIDAANALSTIASDLGPRMPRVCNSIIDVTVRLYGAWQWADGTIIRDRRYLTKACADASTAVHGYPLVFEVADAWPAPRAPVNSYKQDATCRCRYKVRINEQKLVDTMMVCDMIHFATYPGMMVVAVTSDHDVIPGLAQASYLRRTMVGDAKLNDVVWMRPESLAGRADHMLAGVALVTDYASTAT